MSRLHVFLIVALTASCAHDPKRPPDAISADTPIPSPAPDASPATAPPAAPLAVERLNAHAADGDFARLVDRTIDGYVAFNPIAGTYLGLHNADDRLPDLSRAAIDAEIARVTADLAAAKALSRDALSGLNYHDHALLLHHLEGRLFDLTDIREWERNPMSYGDGVSGGLHALIARAFAPAAERMPLATGRLRGVGAVFAAGRANLKNPPREFTEMALELAPGIVTLVDKELPAAFASVTDPALRGPFEEARKAALVEIRAWIDWLNKDLLPRSTGAFALGEERFRRKLFLDEMIDTPVDVLLTKGQELLSRTRNEFIEYAQMIDPLSTPREVLIDKLGADHPAQDKLLSETSAILGELRKFVADKQIITLPEEVDLKVAAMPPFFWGFAAMDTPGPFETRAKEAYYYVDQPKPEWTKAQVAAHLKRFNRPSTTVISIHEAYPGHYVQGLYGRQNPSKLRKVLWSYAFGEGWAHYAEQMMLDEGFHKGDEKMALAQRSEALIRICRYLASLRMHTRGMSVADGKKLFQDQCFQDEETARRETIRGTFDPMYLNYTLGKMLIYELREDYKREVGDARFSLRQFHDQLMLDGGIPLALHREILMAIAAGKREQAAP